MEPVTIGVNTRGYIRRPRSVMAAGASPCITVFVVDPNSSDYAALARRAAKAGWNVRFLSGGRDALRLDENATADLWIVHVRLPDISGFDLVEMLQPRLGNAAVFMVADEYRAEDEIRALSLGITRYLCKPLEADCLSPWHA